MIFSYAGCAFFLCLILQRYGCLPCLLCSAVWALPDVAADIQNGRAPDAVVCRIFPTVVVAVDPVL
jgi:hypothetical protein